VIYEISQGLKAMKQKEAYLARQTEESAGEEALV
jgi:hypothetical protein